MKVYTLLSALIAVAIATKAPILPDRFLAIGNFWVLDSKGHNLIDFGHFNKKYDWASGVQRTDQFYDPQSQSDYSYMVIWNTVDTTLVGILEQDDVKINCSQKDWGYLFQPEILYQICKFDSLDTANGHLANKWKCKLTSDSHIVAWTNKITGDPLKLKMKYEKVTGITLTTELELTLIVIIDFESFDEIDEFDRDLFTPPGSWNCPSLDLHNNVHRINNVF